MWRRFIRREPRWKARMRQETERERREREQASVLAVELSKRVRNR